MTGHHPLPPGQYIVVPCTPDPNIECEFLIRILAEKKNKLKYAAVVELQYARNELELFQ